MLAVASQRRILIVDDEASVADTLRLVLSSRRYEVRTVYSAEEAIEILAEWQPDLAMIDVMLPKMNGIELAGIIAGNYPGCRLLLISGHPGTSELLNDARSHGHTFEILAKPLHPTFILDTVTDMLPGGLEKADA
jgi:DNA-binding NtrC family response regulator